MNKKSKIEQNVMKSINSDKVHMKPKIYYTSISILWLTLTGLLSILSMYIISIISFWIRISLSTGRAYGAKANLAALISEFPWWLTLLSLLIIFVIIYLIRHHSKLYRIKLSIFIPITIITLLLGGYLLSYSDLFIQHESHKQNHSHQK